MVNQLQQDMLAAQSRAAGLADTINQFLKQQAPRMPHVQGIALAGVVATFFCGYRDPAVREEMLDKWQAMVRDCVEAAR